MRKRDALRIALRNLKLPKLEEWEKLLYAGAAILFVCIAFGVGLMIRTSNLAWGSIAVAGILIYLWFGRASMIMREEERLRETVRRRMIVRKLIRKELEKK